MSRNARIREMREDLLAKLELTKIFDDIRENLVSKNKESVSNFQVAKDIYLQIISLREDKKELKVEAYRAFANCYTEIGLSEKAAKMTQKCEQLCREHNLELPT